MKGYAWKTMSVAAVDDVGGVDVGIGSAGFFLGGRRGVFGFESLSERGAASDADTDTDADVGLDEE
jgi:hypothetical protein